MAEVFTFEQDKDLARKLREEACKKTKKRFEREGLIFHSDFSIFPSKPDA